MYFKDIYLTALLAAKYISLSAALQGILTPSLTERVKIACTELLSIYNAML